MVDRVMPKSIDLDLTHVRASSADSEMTSPRLPVVTSRPFPPGTRVDSMSRIPPVPDPWYAKPLTPVSKCVTEGIDSRYNSRAMLLFFDLHIKLGQP